MKEEEKRRLTAWQSFKSVVAGVFTPLVKEVGRLVFPEGTGACLSVNKWYSTYQSVNRPSNTRTVQTIFNT